MKRRGFLTGVAVAVVAAAGGAAAWRFHLFGPYYPPTPYDDLLKQIADREPARIFGQAALRTMPGANAASLARALRTQGNLTALAARDPANGHVVEVVGWVVPETVARYAALAAAV
ncbi:MAG TPA: twin-arginine translocation signal domain-containing protein [Rhizomicrobium sp.]|nr:twin-arginine translocation signal domain-containing protein [Rhizomicrobium sp.]